MTGLPVGIGQGTVTGKLIATQQTPSSDADIDAVPLAGSVTFTPAISKAIHLASSSVIVPRAVTVTLDGTGAFTTKLIATDDPDVNPTGWTYLVSFQLTGAALDPFSISVPDASTTDLSAVVPVAPSAGSGSLVAANITDFTEASQDVIGAMIAAAGGTYNDPAGTITLPAGGAGAAFYAGTTYAPGDHVGLTAGSATFYSAYPTFALVRVDRSRTTAQVLAEVSDTGSGRTMHVGVWAADGPGGLPGTLLFASGAVSTDAAGVKTMTAGFTLPAGWVWVGVQVSATTSLVATHGLRSSALQYTVNSAITSDNSAITTPLTSAPLTGKTVGVTQPAPWVRVVCT